MRANARPPGVCFDPASIEAAAYKVTLQNAVSAAMQRAGLGLRSPWPAS